MIGARGLSAYAVANASGVDRRNVERFLGGGSALRGDSLDRICAALGLTLADGRRARVPVAPASEVVPETEIVPETVPAPETGA